MVERDKVILDLLKQLPVSQFCSHDTVRLAALKRGETEGYARFLADEHARIYNHEVPAMSH